MKIKIDLDDLDDDSIEEIINFVIEKIKVEIYHGKICVSYNFEDEFELEFSLYDVIQYKLNEGYLDLDDKVKTVKALRDSLLIAEKDNSHLN